MKKSLLLAFFLTTFSLFLGIANVYADTNCSYSANINGSHNFSITFDSSGNAKNIYYIGSGIEISGVVLHPNGKRDATSLIDVQVQIRSNTCPSNVKISKDYRKIVDFNQSGDYYTLTYSAPATSNSNSASNSNPSSNGGYASPSWLDSDKVSCGNIGQIPSKAPELVHMFILIAQIAVPIILVILGMIDFAKGIMSQKEDDIKKGQKTFINRLIMGAVIFFVVALVKLLIGIVVDNTGNRQNIIACIDCFVNNDCN